MEMTMTEIGSHVVDYRLRLREMIDAGSYDRECVGLNVQMKFWSFRLLLCRLPLVGKGRVEFEDTLFHFGRDICSREAFKLIVAADTKNPWMPARIENLLAYGAQKPDAQCKGYRIAALRAVCRTYCGRVGLALSENSSAGRILIEHPLSVEWFRLERFLAVRKKADSI